MSTSAYRMEVNEQAYNNQVSTTPRDGVIVNFEEYRTKREGKKKARCRKSKKGISVWGVILAGVGGFLAAAGTVALTGLVEERAVFVLYILWLFFGGALACWLDNVGV